MRLSEESFDWIWLTGRARTAVPFDPCSPKSEEETPLKLKRVYALLMNRSQTETRSAWSERRNRAVTSLTKPAFCSAGGLVSKAIPAGERSVSQGTMGWNGPERGTKSASSSFGDYKSATSCGRQPHAAVFLGGGKFMEEKHTKLPLELEDAFGAEEERLEKELTEKIGVPVDYSTVTPLNFLKFFILSAIGIWVFFIPITVGGTSSTP
ncbi:MAG: hypothetical protein AAGU02_08620, partial [Lawsonibacter sp.]